MMADRRATNRAMFWRILRRLFGANPGRLFVMLLALGAGAAVTAALLNLQVDAKRRLTKEFRVFGANIVVTPSGQTNLRENSAMLQEQNVARAIRDVGYPSVVSAPFLYFVTSIQKGGDSLVPERRTQLQVVGAGTQLDAPLHILIPGWVAGPLWVWDESDEAMKKGHCVLGVKVAQQMHLHDGDAVELFYGDRAERLKNIRIISTGGNEDNQVFIELRTAQQLTRLDGRASLVEISYPGTPQEITRFQSALAAKLPEAEVKPIRQFTEGEAKIYSRISGLLTATVGIVLLLTGLCVMAAMTNVAMERKMDVGLMKAIGGSMRRVLRLFLAEAALLGLAGGMIGAASGIFLSIGLGKAVFGVAARPRLIVYPVAVALTVIVAILSAFPLRRLASIRPASVFRGEA
jgi:putative ABC transport system permease protein